MITLHQLYTQLISKAQRDPTARVRDFKISVKESSDGRPLLYLHYTKGQGRARDLAATVLAFYGDSYQQSGSMHSKMHWLSGFYNPAQRIYGSHIVELYAEK